MLLIQRQMVSSDTIRLPVARSTDPDQVAVSASFTPQTGINDTESRRSLEGSVTTDDSVSPIQTIYDINLDSS